MGIIHPSSLHRSDSIRPNTFNQKNKTLSIKHSTPNGSSQSGSSNAIQTSSTTNRNSEPNFNTFNKECDEMNNENCDPNFQNQCTNDNSMNEKEEICFNSPFSQYKVILKKINKSPLLKDKLKCLDQEEIIEFAMQMTSEALLKDSYLNIDWSKSLLLYNQTQLIEDHINKYVDKNIISNGIIGGFKSKSTVDGFVHIGMKSPPTSVKDEAMKKDVKKSKASFNSIDYTFRNHGLHNFGANKNFKMNTQSKLLHVNNSKKPHNYNSIGGESFLSNQKFNCEERINSSGKQFNIPLSKYALQNSLNKNINNDNIASSLNEDSVDSNNTVNSSHTISTFNINNNLHEDGNIVVEGKITEDRKSTSNSSIFDGEKVGKFHGKNFSATSISSINSVTHSSSPNNGVNKNDFNAEGDMPSPMVSISPSSPTPMDNMIIPSELTIEEILNLKNGSNLQENVRIKLLISETAHSDAERTIRQLVSPLLNVLNVLPEMGLFHSALIIGPWKLEWNDSGLVIPRKIVSSAAIMSADIDHITTIKELSSVTDKLSKVIVKWNTKMKYKDSGGDKKKYGNCQDFVDDVLKELDIKLNFSGPLERFIHKLRKTGKCNLEFPLDVDFQKKFNLKNTKGISFKSHKELDIFVDCLLQIDPKFPENYKGEWTLLKSFDRAYWLKYLKFKEKEEFKPFYVEKKNGDNNESEDDNSCCFDEDYKFHTLKCPFNNPTSHSFLGL